MNIVLTKVLPAAQSGDLAIALAQIGALRERFPGAGVTLMCRCPQDDAHWFSEADRVLSELFPLNGEPAYRRLMRFLRILTGRSGDAIADEYRAILGAADVLVFCGGGSAGGYGFGNLLLNAWCPMLLARRLGVPVLLPGLGLARPRGRIHRWLLSRVLNNADAVTVRDPLSFELVQKRIPGTLIEQSADWAWLLPAAEKKTADAFFAEAGCPENGSVRVGVNLRSNRAVGPDGERGAGTAFPGEVLVRCLPVLIEQLEAEVYVFSMNAPPASDDLAYARELLSVIEPDYQCRIHLLQGEYHPSAIKAMIATMDLFIGTRLHPSLFAASTGVPTVTVHDQDKVRGFMQQIGMEHWHLPASGLESGDLLQKVLDLHARGEDISAQLERQIAEMEKAARLNLNGISAVLPEHGRERSL